MSDIEHREDLIMQNETRDMLDFDCFYPDIEHREDLIMLNETRDMLDFDRFYCHDNMLMLDDIIDLFNRMTI